MTLMLTNTLTPIHPYGGNHRLRGTLNIGPDPDPAPGYQIHLFVETRNSPGGLTPSGLRSVGVFKSEAGGEWLCDYLAESRTFTVIAYDHTGTYDPVIKAGLIPEPME